MLADGSADQLARTTVLIPAAGRVPEGILALGNISCPAMIPVAGRPVIHWTLHYLRSLGLRRFSIAVARRGMFVEDFVECTFGSDCEVTFHVPTADRGVGHTVLELAERAVGTSALVVLGDTYFQFADPDSAPRGRSGGARGNGQTIPIAGVPSKPIRTALSRRGTTKNRGCKARCRR